MSSVTFGAILYDPTPAVPTILKSSQNVFTGYYYKLNFSHFVVEDFVLQNEEKYSTKIYAFNVL